MAREDMIVDFLLKLGCEMMKCGSNPERVSISIQRICKVYELTDVSIFILNSLLSISVKDKAGVSHMGQETISSNGIHLRKLNQLNRLVHQIMHEKIKPEELDGVLEDTLKVEDYPMLVTIAGYVMAMICLCKIFGGTWQDMIVVSINTLILYFVMNAFAKEKLNRIISNIVAMFLCGCIAIFFIRAGFAKHLSAIIITNAFYLIPGIPMVNAFRNIICGNEMNGIIEMVKVLLEVVTIVAGLYIACVVLGPGAIVFFGAM